MQYVFYFFSAYAVLNFAIFIFNRLQTTSVSGDAALTLADWRGFSGHWMAFYLGAFIILRW